VRRTLLTTFNLEVGAGLGPLAGKIWRVGLMGASSTPLEPGRVFDPTDGKRCISTA
jgi:alanine-glyoxylate transaminase/serine-glyoxylate transaminase/serine-pyruvate transaminase